MEFIDMLKDKTLLTGFVELLENPDTKIIKRTSRVIASMYSQALNLMTMRQMEGSLLDESWPTVLDLTNRLMDLIKESENEGVTFCLVHFIDQAVSAHLSNDVSGYPVVASAGRDVVKKGLKVLKELVSTPYVGGIVFLTAVRSLIRIACLRTDLYEPVTDLIRKQMDNLPPTLFDHNVRSLHKMLQKNLFRLLRRAHSAEHKKKLIEMMVIVGVPRKMMAPWAPVGVSMKRASPTPRISPPLKRQCVPPPVASADKCKPLTGFELLTSLIPKPTFSMEEAEKWIALKLTMDNVCSIIIDNLDNVPDIMPADFARQFNERTIVGDITHMRLRLSSLLADTFSSEQLKAFIATSKTPPTRPSAPTPSEPTHTPPISPPTRDIDMRIPPADKAASQITDNKSTDLNFQLATSQNPSSTRDVRSQERSSRDPRAQKEPSRGPPDVDSRSRFEPVRNALPLDAPFSYSQPRPPMNPIQSRDPRANGSHPRPQYPPYAGSSRPPLLGDGPGKGPFNPMRRGPWNNARGHRNTRPNLHQMYDNMSR